jgi:hypothetical protein
MTFSARREASFVPNDAMMVLLLTPPLNASENAGNNVGTSPSNPPCTKFGMYLKKEDRAMGLLKGLGKTRLLIARICNGWIVVH